MPCSRTWVVSHCVCRPWPHMKHVPQAIWNGTTTRSPAARSVTAAPTSSTMPIGSCPRMSPSVMNGAEHLVEVQVRAARDRSTSSG